MKLSVCMNTARENYPMIDYPDKHIFELLIGTLRGQKFDDFELVIADYKFDERSDYFKGHNESFNIVHIPVKKNVWTENKLYAISTTKNTALSYASGDVITFIDDCGVIAKNYLEQVYEMVNDGFVVNSGFFQVGVNNNYVYYHPGLNSGFNNITAKAEIFDKINGYNELLDGGRGWEDEDVFMRALTVNNGRGKLNHNPIVYFAHNYKLDIRVDIPRYCDINWRRYILKKGRDGQLVTNKSTITKEDIDEFLSSSYKECGHRDGNKCKYISNCIYCENNIEERLLSEEESIDHINKYKDNSLVFDLKQQRNINTKKA